MKKKQTYTRQDVEDLLERQRDELADQDKDDLPSFWVTIGYFVFLFGLACIVMVATK